jgi:hypothetical protein
MSKGHQKLTGRRLALEVRIPRHGESELCQGPHENKKGNGS